MREIKAILEFFLYFYFVFVFVFVFVFFFFIIFLRCRHQSKEKGDDQGIRKRRGEKRRKQENKIINERKCQTNKIFVLRDNGLIISLFS